MIKKILFNPSDKDISDYRIEEISFDENGAPLLDREGMVAKTGRTLEWSIKAGERLEFPGYVADYLREIYPFLEEVGAQSEPTEPVETPTAEEARIAPGITEVSTEAVEAQPTEGSISCKACGTRFKNLKAMGLHFAARHPELLMNG